MSKLSRKFKAAVLAGDLKALVGRGLKMELRQPDAETEHMMVSVFIVDRHGDVLTTLWEAPMRVGDTFTLMEFERAFEVKLRS